MYSHFQRVINLKHVSGMKLHILLAYLRKLLKFSQKTGGTSQHTKSTLVTCFLIKVLELKYNLHRPFTHSKPQSSGLVDFPHYAVITTNEL